MLERAAFRKIASGDIERQYGYAIRLCVTVNRWQADTKVSLPFLAASAQLGTIEAQWILQVIGLYGKEIDAAILPPTELNVDTFVIAKQSLEKIITALRDPSTKFQARLIAEIHPPDAEQQELRALVARAYALSSIERGRSLTEAKNHLGSDDGIVQDALATVYEKFGGLTNPADTPQRSVARPRKSPDGSRRISHGLADRMANYLIGMHCIADPQGHGPSAPVRDLYVSEGYPNIITAPGDKLTSTIKWLAGKIAAGAFHDIAPFLLTISELSCRGPLRSRNGRRRKTECPARIQLRDVELAPGLAEEQFEQTQAVLMSLNEDSLLKPWRLRAGLPAPGPDLGGWYDETPLKKTESGGHGFAPGHCFGQWISALARGYSVNHNARTRARLERLLALYEPTISGRFYTNFRFPAYNYDKMVIGLIDAHRFAGLTQSYRLLDKTTNAAEPHLPPTALDRDEPQRRWRKSVGEDTGDDYTWDESYTLPENLYLAWERGAGERYRKLAARFLLDKTYFDPLSENKDVLANHHAYSFCNALSSAMQAYLVDGSRKHLRATANAFDMISATQSFATGGWGPNESFSAPGSDTLFLSLSGTHRGFETPCGSYAHFKLTRYLLRVTQDGRYGDSMERVFYNTVLGAKRLQPDGRAFYYSDYHSPGRKSYFPDAWPCCSGTLPQVAADYRLLAYFHDGDDIFVNLYLPSTVRWTSADGAQLTLGQTGAYPMEGKITMRLRTSRPSSFALKLRIPAWSSLGSMPVISVNGRSVATSTQAGFATLRRRWKDGDRIELELALQMRLEAIDTKHPDTVALLRGPLVLFPITESHPAVTRRQLLSAARLPRQPIWQAESGSGPLRLLPFSAITDERYTTYLNAGGQL